MKLRYTVSPKIVAFCMITLAVPFSSQAQDGYGAHEHGVGQLNVAVEGQTLEMELIVPGADIVGFEHAAESAQDKAAVATAIARLEAAEQLFAFAGPAGCRLEEAEVHTDLLPEEHHTENHAHHDHADEEAEGHGEFRAHYHFNCGQIDALSYMETAYFQAFPAARELLVQAITDRGQRAEELTPARNRLDF